MSDLTLTEFLAARYAEAEAHARDVHERRCGTSPELVADPLGRPMPVECECDWHVVGVLADVAAKRRIVGMYRSATEDFIHFDQTHDEFTNEVTLETVVELLAQPYSQHADFDPGWKL